MYPGPCGVFWPEAFDVADQPWPLGGQRSELAQPEIRTTSRKFAPHHVMERSIEPFKSHLTRPGLPGMVKQKLELLEKGDPSENRSLVLVDSFMGDEGATAVVDALRHNSSVKSLDLRGCNIRSEGASALAGLLEHNMNLTSVGLEWNSVGMLESGIQSISKALMGNHHLTELDLRSNGISPTGGTALANMLAVNKGLKRLDLRWNNIGASGGKALCDGMHSNNHVLELLVAGNKISDENLRQLEQLMARNRGEAVNMLSQSAVSESQNERSRWVTGVSFRGSGSPEATPPPKRSVYESPALRQLSPSDGRSFLSSHISVEAVQEEVNHFINSTSRLKHSVSGELLQQHFREKIMEMSRQLMQEKESFVSLEKRYYEEVEYRGDLEAKISEYEKKIANLEESLASERTVSELRYRETTTEFDRERSGRKAAEQQLRSVQIEMEELQREYERHSRESGNRLKTSATEVKVLQQDYDKLNREMDEHRHAAEERQSRLIAELRQTEDQRVILERDYQATAEKLADAENQISESKREAGRRLEGMEERIRSLERERQAAEDNVHKTKRELEGKVKEMSGTLQKQEETIGQLHDSLRSVTVARDRLQSSVEVLSGEAAEAKRAEAGRRSDLEQKLKETMERLAEEVKKNDRCNTELKKAQARVQVLEASVVKLEAQGKAKAEANEEAMRKVMAEMADNRRELEQVVAKAEGRIAALDVQLQAKEQDLIKLRDEEARRYAMMEERLLGGVRDELSKARPNIGKWS